MTQQLGRYRLDAELGRGGMAVVYAGVAEGEEGFRKPVVVKRIHPHLTRDRRFVDLLIREAKLTVRLEHPNVVQVLELGREGDDYFIVLERVRGGDLAQLLEAAAGAGVRFPPRLAAHVTRELLAALAYAHAVRDDDGSPLGIIHRDISPTNVLVAHDGRVRITDFGIARTAFGGEATEGGLKGKLPYMSPEQARGETVGPAGDLYATGLVLFEMLTGQRALDGSDEMAVLSDARRGASPALDRHADGIPDGFRDPLRRALRADPEERFPDARAMREALAPLSHGRDEGQERLAEMMALVLPDRAGSGAAVPSAETRPPPVRTQTLVTRPLGSSEAPARITPTSGEKAEPASVATEDRLQRQRLYGSLGILAAGGISLLVLVWWQPWQQGDATVAGGPAPRLAETEPAAEPFTDTPLATTMDLEEAMPVNSPAVAPEGTPPPAPDAAVEAPATEEPTPIELAPSRDGTLSVVVQGGTGLVHVDAPGWVDRYAPLSAAEVPAGRWTVTVHRADTGTMWSGVVEIPAGGTAGVLLEPGPGGGWAATVR